MSEMASNTDLSVNEGGGSHPHSTSQLDNGGNSTQEKHTYNTDSETAGMGTPESSKAGPEYISGTRLVLVVTAVAIACFLMLLDGAIIGTAIPKITDEFNSLDDIGWYGSAYSLGSAALQPLTGKIYHHFNLKWSFLVYVAAFELGSVLCGAAQSSTMLIIGRAVAGAGASGLLNGAINIISASVPLEKRPPLIGMVMGVAQLGYVIAPLIGGAFTTGYTWRWCFYVNLPLGALVATSIIFIRMPEPLTKERARDVLPNIPKYLDLPGFVLLAGAVVELLLSLQYGGNQFAWDSSQVIGLLVGAVLTFIVWIFWNHYKGDDALLPVSILKMRIVWVSALNYSFLLGALIGVSYYLPLYFQAVKGVNAIMSGVYFLPMILSQLLTAVVAGRLVPRVGYIPPFAIYGTVLTAVGCGLFSLFQPDTSTGRWIGFQVLTGLGCGAALQMPIIATQNAVTENQLSAAMAFIVWAQNMGPTIFLTLYQTIFNNSLRPELARTVPHADAAAIVAAGATAFRSVVDPVDLSGVLVAYSTSLDRVFYLVAAAACVSFVASFGMGWGDIRKKGCDQ